jgi:hypothetical protein
MDKITSHQLNNMHSYSNIHYYYYYYYYGCTALCWALATFQFLDSVHSQ